MGVTFPLIPRRRIHGLPLGSMRSVRREAGWDLAGSRAYRPGDDFRSIDRRTSARLSSARGSDEYVVNQHHTEEAARVVIVVDRRPAMALFPESLPWLHKPRVIRQAGALIGEAADEERSFVGYLDEGSTGIACGNNGDVQGPYWAPPDGRLSRWDLEQRCLSRQGFTAPNPTLARALRFLCTQTRELRAGTFIFVLSDFTVFPDEDAWAEAETRGLELVPVVIQDPIWEQSFPSVSGVSMPVVEPGGGRVRLVRLRRSEVADLARANEERLSMIKEFFDRLGSGHVLLSSEEPSQILGAFRRWAASRTRAVSEVW